jgi:hypothetical protein
MKHMPKWLRYTLLAVLVPVVVVVALVASVHPVMYTAVYSPASQPEAEAAKRANETVYPQDVQDSLAKYTGTLVVWPGILRGSDAVPGADSIRWSFEHHYFDWKEDHGRQRELYFLSPRGEGCFSIVTSATWSPKTGFTGKPIPGALVIVYGTPTAIDTIDNNPVIRLTAVAANALDAQWYRTDMFSYGRGLSDLKVRRPDSKDNDWFGPAPIIGDCGRAASIRNSTATLPRGN